MLAVFAALVPVFLLIVLGYGLRRSLIKDGSHWTAIEQLVYYVLFPALLEAGLPREGGPVQVMLAEHDAGRKLVAAMSRALADHQAGQTGAAAALQEVASEYAKLLTDHISKEDNVLYLIADEKIAAPVQAAMVEAFEKIEEERIGVGTHERYHEMLKEFRHGYLSTK